jgi:hypothetical protein
MKTLRTWLLAISATASFASSATEYASRPEIGTWTTTLQARDPNRDGVIDAYFDTTLQITWVADWKLAQTMGTGLTDENGQMGWREAISWVQALDFHGASGWRLPTGIYNSAPNEFASLIFDTMGNPVGDGFTWVYNYGPFRNFRDGLWSAQSCDTPERLCAGGPTEAAFMTRFSTYSWTDVAMSSPYTAIAVHDGDVFAVPEPASATLLALGIAFIGGFARKRYRA